MKTESFFLNSFFDRLNENNIKYAVLRNYLSLPDSCGGSDIDLWVKVEDYDQFKICLDEVALACHGFLSSYCADEMCPRLIYQAPGWGVQFDVHLGVAQYKGVAYMNNSIIENNITEYNGIKVLAPEIDGLISFLKEILNNKKCKESYCISASHLVTTLEKKNLREYLKAFSESVQNNIIYCLKNKDYSKESIKKLGDLCSSDLLSLSANLRYKLILLKKLTRLFKQPGYTLAFLGTDGSGKSFVIDHVSPILNGGFHNGIIYNHMRPNYLPSLAVATGKKKTEDHSVCTDPHASKPAGFVGSIIRLSYYWLDYTWGYFRKVFPDKSVKTHVWLFDRYYYDYYVDQRRARLNLPSWIVKFYGLFVPSPDLTICLGGDPEKIYARKPETSLEEVTRQTNVLKEFARTHKNTVWIDTTVTPEETIKATMDAIVNMMSKRFAK